MKRNLGFRTEFGSTKTRVVVFRTKKRCDFSKKGMGLFAYCKPDSVGRPVGVEGGNANPKNGTDLMRGWGLIRICQV